MHDAGLHDGLVPDRADRVRQARPPSTSSRARGISRLRFEAFTLRTLAVIIAFAVVGYWLGRPVRAQEADLSLVAPAPA
jgi:hypothetical protein